MNNTPRVAHRTCASLFLLVATTLWVLPTLAAAQGRSPVQSIRNKISAGDLRSAESILEVHRQRNGEGDQHLVGLSWLARGAMLLDEETLACAYADEVREIVAGRVENGESLRGSRALQTAWGAASEVKAQCILYTEGEGAARRFLEGEINGVDAALVALRSRLYKRMNLFTLAGSPAPDIAVQDWVGDRPPTLGSLRGTPVVLFMWAEWCGDCKAQAALLAHARRTFEDQGLRFLAITRYYDDEAQREEEKQRVESVWQEDYADVGELPILISSAAMERYGVAATPTWVFIDREGVVFDYSPVRLTEAEFERRAKAILEP